MINVINVVVSFFKHLRAFIFKRWRFAIAHLYERHLYVMLDPVDSSVTFSRNLVHVVRALYEVPHIHHLFAFLFRTESGEYAFMINRFSPNDTVVTEVQYNFRARSAGFQASVPNVDRILAEYALPYNKKAFLPVSLHITNDGYNYFLIHNNTSVQ